MERTILEEKMKEELIKAKRKVYFRDSLRTNDRYINWLENFAIKTGGFDTLALVYNADKYNYRDRENIEDLEILYEAISEFAESSSALLRTFCNSEFSSAKSLSEIICPSSA